MKITFRRKRTESTIETKKSKNCPSFDIYGDVNFISIDGKNDNCKVKLPNEMKNITTIKIKSANLQSFKDLPKNAPNLKEITIEDIPIDELNEITKLNNLNTLKLKNSFIELNNLPKLPESLKEINIDNFESNQSISQSMFGNATHISLTHGNIKNFQLEKNTIETIDLSNNNIDTFDIVDNNNIKSLNLSNNPLNILKIDKDSQISTIDISHTKLEPEFLLENLKELHKLDAIEINFNDFDGISKKVDLSISKLTPKKIKSLYGLNNNQIRNLIRYNNNIDEMNVPVAVKEKIIACKKDDNACIELGEFYKNSHLAELSFIFDNPESMTEAMIDRILHEWNYKTTEYLNSKTKTKENQKILHKLGRITDKYVSIKPKTNNKEQKKYEFRILL